MSVSLSLQFFNEMEVLKEYLHSTYILISKTSLNNVKHSRENAGNWQYSVSLCNVTL